MRAPLKNQRTPWDDCKVAFGLDSSDVARRLNAIDCDLLGRMTPSALLPKGWTLDGTDGTGARYVAIFRVDGPLRWQDGVEVRNMLNKLARKT